MLCAAQRRNLLPLFCFFLWGINSELKVTLHCLTFVFCNNSFCSLNQTNTESSEGKCRSRYFLGVLELVTTVTMEKKQQCLFTCLNAAHLNKLNWEMGGGVECRIRRGQTSGQPELRAQALSSCSNTCRGKLKSQHDQTIGKNYINCSKNLFWKYEYENFNFSFPISDMALL